MVSSEELQRALQELRQACDTEIRSAEEYKRAAETYKETVEEMLADWRTRGNSHDMEHYL